MILSNADVVENHGRHSRLRTCRSLLSVGVRISSSARGGERRSLHLVQRKVGAPQNRMLVNGQARQRDGKCSRK